MWVSRRYIIYKLKKERSVCKSGVIGVSVLVLVFGSVSPVMCWGGCTIEGAVCVLGVLGGDV